MSKLLFLFLFTILFSHSVCAASLQLTRIGQMDTTGGSYREWWYTGVNPSMQGLSQPNGTVTVSINDVANRIIADESGYWIYSGGGLESGDYKISITDGSETLNFTLHTGQDRGEKTVTATSETGNTTEMPVSGNLGYTLGLALCGILVALIGIRLRPNLLPKKT